MQVEERRRVPLPRHWIGKMSCGGRSSAMWSGSRRGKPNLAMGSGRGSGTRDAAVTFSYEEDPFCATTVLKNLRSLGTTVREKARKKLR
jgi:hypothetical protein